jgi:outer membrane protein assembly factor BamB
MRHLLLALGLATSGCSLYFDGPGDEPPVPPPEPQPVQPHFVITHSMAADAPIVGMDADSEGGVWVAHRREVGGFYDNDHVRVVHLDATGANVAEFSYEDDYTRVSGLAFSGDAIWLNYADHLGNAHVRKIDPATGDVLTRIGTEYGIEDLDVFDGELRLSTSWNEIIGLDLETGAQQWRKGFDHPGFTYSTQRGIASDPQGFVWTTSWNSEKLFMFAPSSGTIVTEATTDAGHQTVAGGQQLFLASDGDQLVIAIGSQIFWLDQQ